MTIPSRTGKLSRDTMVTARHAFKQRDRLISEVQSTRNKLERWKATLASRRAQMASAESIRTAEDIVQTLTESLADDERVLAQWRGMIYDIEAAAVFVAQPILPEN